MTKLFANLIQTSLYVLCISVFMSITLMAGFHIFMALPIIYFAFQYKWKKFPLSAWALLALCLIMIISVVANQDITSNGYSNITKVKYFIIGALSIIPLDFYFNQYLGQEARDKKLKSLLWVFLIFACTATFSGLVGFFTGYNPIKMKYVSVNRNSGMFGMLMTYAHSMAMLCSLLIAMIFNHKQMKKWIPSWMIILTFVVSFVGLFLTYTRGALLAFLVSFIFVSKKFAAICIAGILVLVIALSIKNPKFIKENIIRPGSQEERYGSWLGAIEAFKERPAFGYGYQNYEPHSSEIKKRYNIMNAYFVGHAHNNFLEILATTGAIGFILFCAWLGLWGKDIIKRNDLMAKLLLPFFVCFIVGGLTQVTFNDGENAFFFLAVYAFFYITRETQPTSV